MSYKTVYIVKKKTQVNKERPDTTMCCKVKEECGYI